MIRLTLFFLIILVATFSLKAQETPRVDDEAEQEIKKRLMLDDSTRQVYGPHSLHFTTQDKIKYNQKGSLSIETSASNLHRFTFMHQHKNKIQNLGNNGTAAKRIFYHLPDQIGVSSGFNAYDSYFKNSSQFKYYTTKSPFSKLHLVVGEHGRSLVRIPYSRNVTKNWNIGADFRSLIADKQFGQAFTPGDRNVVSYAYDFFTHFKTSHEKYQLLAYFFRMHHRVKETGGIQAKAGYTFKDFFQATVNSNLENVKSRELRQHYHAYQQFAFLNQLQVYHEFDWINKFNYFEIEVPPLPTEVAFLGDSLVQSTFAQDRTFMKSFWNEVGCKGDLAKLFYLCYYRRRDVNLAYKYLDDSNKLVEHYAGIQTRYTFKDSTTFHLSGTYLDGGLYKVEAAYQSPFFDLSYEGVKYKPSFLVQNYRSSYREWSNNFESPTAFQVKGSVSFGWPFLALRPHATLSKVNKHIYFNQQKMPTQAAANATIILSGIEADLTLWKHVHADNHCIFANVKGPASDVFRVPKFLLNSKVYYENNFFKNKLELETGLDMHFKSAYLADNYDPVTQQFFLQDSFLVHDYLIADLFLNFRIKNFKMFFKVTHINQRWFDPGYFVTPFYPGQRSALDLGISWAFFD